MMPTDPINSPGYLEGQSTTPKVWLLPNRLGGALLVPLALFQLLF